jgi:hypothetical protein
MPVRPQTLDFIRELEHSSHHKLSFPNDVGELIDAARRHQSMEILEEAIFLAKFITKSVGVMKRIGPDGDGYDKLASEVQAGIQKASTLLKTLSDRCPVDVAQIQFTEFFAMNHAALERLMKLFADLALVKNWVLDKKPLP